MWLVLGATVIVASLFAGRSDRARLVARVALGVLFLVFGALVNVIYLVTDWESFADFGEMSQLPFVRDTWGSLVAPNTGVFIGLLIAGEATAGILVLCGGRWTQAGLVLLLAFHVGLLFFGWWLWLYAVPMLGALALLLRAERRHQHNPAQPLEVGHQGVTQARADRVGRRRSRLRALERADPVMASDAPIGGRVLEHAGPRHPDPTWAPLYRAGGWSALVYVLLVVVPVVLVFVAPVPPTQGAALLEYIAAHKVVYLVELVCFVGLAVPALVVFGAVAVAVKDVNKSIAAIGGLFGIASEVIALALGSSPQSLHGGLVVLSNAYRDAAGDAERASVTSAADALIAATNAVSWAGILTAAAILLLSSIMRTAAFFGPVVGTLGMLTGAVGILAEALRPMMGAGYLVYGLLLPLWFGLVGWKLLHVDGEAVS